MSTPLQQPTSRHIPKPNSYLDRRPRPSKDGKRLAGMTLDQSAAYRRINRWRRRLEENYPNWTTAECEARLDRIESEMARFFPIEWASIEMRRGKPKRTHLVERQCDTEERPLAS